ncbi:hypothetical protein [Glycomyces albidus]|uniref:Uncharacterized protein n=1 Tax=Glycomyces albidus TaxID=2656774 RepID=A0A6L5G573_9ACTN|nr:hypothetical protein [Glycomyces albidus]MQM24777.1 hypothetical protein [Glycomyces albidus]
MPVPGIRGSADQASLSAELGALAPAAPGSEFLFVQFATQADYLADFSHDGLAATAWIEVGTERIELSEPPDNADFLVASVPVGEPAVLWVDDMGRAQGLDLRTGERIDPVAAYYGELGFWTDELEGFEYLDVRFVGDGGWWWTAGCHDRIVELTRSAWTADRGWAPEGSVYLSFQFRWCDASYQDVIWTLDTDRALLLETAGEYRVPDGWATEPYVGTPGSTTYTAVFEVPADVADFHLVFVPAGELVEKDSGEVFLQETMPAITEWAVSF